MIIIIINIKMYNKIIFPKICSIALMVKEFLIAHYLVKISGKIYVKF